MNLQIFFICLRGTAYKAKACTIRVLLCVHLDLKLNETAFFTLGALLLEHGEIKIGCAVALNLALNMREVARAASRKVVALRSEALKK